MSKAAKANSGFSTTLCFLLPADADVTGALIQQEPTVAHEKQHPLPKKLSEEDTEARLTLALHLQGRCGSLFTGESKGWRRRAEVEEGVAHDTLCFGLQTVHNNETNKY